MKLLKEIKSNNLHIWSSEINAHELKFQDYFASLDEAELIIAKNIRSTSTYKMFVTSHGWFKLILSRYLDCNANKLTIEKNIAGKPFLVDHPQLSFNLSHSSGKMLFAVAWNCLLGVDVEEYEPRSELKNIAETCFSDKEFIYWCSLPSELKTKIFYKIWTRKEAFFKAIGTGITIGMKGCVIKPNLLDNFINVPSEYSPATDWHITELDLWHKASSVIVTNKTFNNTKILT